MKAQGVPEPDCLFVPGHTGDFISGGHIPANAFERSSFTVADAADAVFSKHYGLAPLKFFDTNRQTWAERIRERLERDGIVTAWEYADVCEKWEWQERQAKFIGNSVRVYEFFGYDWWMPLWDLEFVEFWEGVPLDLRKEREWYKAYVSGQFSLQSADDQSSTLTNAADLAGIAKFFHQTKVTKTLKEIKLLRAFARKLIGKNSKKSSLGWEGWFSDEAYKNYQLRNVSINGMVASAFLENTKI